jgi:hypothetical protein
MVIAQEPASESPHKGERLIIDDNLLLEGGLQSAHRGTHAVATKSEGTRVATEFTAFPQP